MYRIYCDEDLIYDPRDLDLNIISGKVAHEVNKTGSLTFSLPITHQKRNTIHKLTSVIKVLDGNAQLFEGRLLTTESDMYGTLEFTCEGELAYLLDSIQRPKSYSNLTPRIYLQDKISQHNSQVEATKQFSLGIVEKQDMNYNAREDKQYTNTLSTIMDKLIKSNGGYLCIRRQNGVRYLDYLESFGRSSGQTIRFGENILDLAEHISAENVITVLIPLGKASDGSPEGEKLTIASVNGGRDYIENAEAISLYGRITGTNVWDDVTLPQNLKTKGEEYLKDMRNLTLTIELTAIDLHLVDVDIDRLMLGDMVHVVSVPHGIDRYMLITKREYDLVNPANDKIVLGDTLKALSHKQFETQKAVEKQKNMESAVQSLGTSVAQVSGTIEKMGEKFNELDTGYSSVQEQIEAVSNNVAELSILHKDDVSDIEGKITTILERLEILEGGVSAQ